MDDIETLVSRPFTRAMAREAGLTDRMLQSKRFVRVFPRVWRHADHTMTDDDWRTAATLALPSSAHLTGISRIQATGLDFGPRLPLCYFISFASVTRVIDAIEVGDWLLHRGELDLP